MPLFLAGRGLEHLPITQVSWAADPLQPVWLWSERFQYQNITSRAAAGSGAVITVRDTVGRLGWD